MLFCAYLFVKNKKGGFEFSQLDAARSGSALTVSLRLGHTRVLTAIQGCHSLPSCRCATSKAVIHYRARSNPLVKRKRGIRILASRRRSARLGSDVPKGTSFTTEPVRIPCAKRKRTPSVSFSFWPALGDSNPQPSESESDTLSNCAKGRY